MVGSPTPTFHPASSLVMIMVGVAWPPASIKQASRAVVDSLKWSDKNRRSSARARGAGRRPRPDRASAACLPSSSRGARRVARRGGERLGGLSVRASRPAARRTSSLLHAIGPPRYVTANDIDANVVRMSPAGVASCANETDRLHLVGSSGPGPRASHRRKTASGAIVDQLSLPSLPRHCCPARRCLPPSL